MKIRSARDDPHPFATTTSHCLDQHRVADTLRRSSDVCISDVETERLLRPRHDRDTGGGGDLSCGRLAAYARDRFRRRTDERQRRVATRAGEVFVLGKKSVTRMHSVRARGARRVDDSIDAKVAV